MAKCFLCGQTGNAGRPMLKLDDIHVCYQCVEGLDYRMLTSEMGAVAADRLLSLIRGTHPEILPQEQHDDSPVLEV